MTLDPGWITVQFRERSGLSVGEQINGVVSAVVDHMPFQHGRSVVGDERGGPLAAAEDVRRQEPQDNYKSFFSWIRRLEMFKTGSRGALEYSDVFPFVYVKTVLDGVREREQIKHVVVDGMQDYTPVQYRVISRLYPSKMTILGDRNQPVNPFGSSCAESIRSVLPDAECVYMQKSYRSTIEITKLAQSVIHNPYLVPMERHGEEPRILGFPGKAKELDYILKLVRAFPQSGFNSTGITSKTQKQADSLYQSLQAESDVRLVGAKCQEFGAGVVIGTAHLAKGLEFDQVIVPFCTDKE